MDVSVELHDLVKTSDDIYFSKLMNNGEELIFQTKKNQVYLNKDKQKAKLTLDEESIKTIRAIAEEVIRITSENSKSWFDKEISIEDCNSIYKDAIVDSVLHCFFDENSVFFSCKDQFSIEDLECELKGIALLNCVGVVYTKTSFFIRWEISQFKIKTDKKSVNEYLIKDLDEHDRSLQDENIAKKLQDITLF